MEHIILSGNIVSSALVYLMLVRAVAGMVWVCVAATFPLTVVTVVSPGVQCSCAAPPLENMLVTAIRYRHVPQDGQKLIVNFYILLEEKLFSTKFARERGWRWPVFIICQRAVWGVRSLVPGLARPGPPPLTRLSWMWLSLISGAEVRAVSSPPSPRILTGVSGQQMMATPGLSPVFDFG